MTSCERGGPCPAAAPLGIAVLIPTSVQNIVFNSTDVHPKNGFIDCARAPLSRRRAAR